ncbi:MAG TPA: DUF4956 domain-containing protein [Bacteroidia bacterium]|jgi:hypothetical protein|nr:DUF4956 domain-containing protein [Bacteroidia bacterium]
MTLLQLLDENALSSVDAITKISFKIGFRILIDLASVFILVRYIYFPIYRNREFFFMFVIFNLIIFLVSFLLNKVELSMGAAFGLFAVFSMLRYRTENITIKDMTYLFLSIAIGLVSAVTKIKDTPDSYEYLFLISINLVILLITYLLESKIFIKKEMIKTIIYENIELIQSNRQEELLADIRQRTGINVHRVSVQQINFLKDSAQLKIYYYE